MTDTVTALEQAARRGEPVTALDLVAAQGAERLSDLQAEGAAAAVDAARARKRSTEIDALLDALDQGSPDTTELDAQLVAVLAALAEVIERRNQQIYAAASRLGALRAVGPSQPAQTWTGTVVDQRAGHARSHNIDPFGSHVAQLLRRTTNITIVAALRDAL